MTTSLEERAVTEPVLVMVVKGTVRVMPLA
jgi:hypothetical protein